MPRSYQNSMRKRKWSRNICNFCSSFDSEWLVLARGIFWLRQREVRIALECPRLLLQVCCCHVCAAFTLHCQASHWLIIVDDYQGKTAKEVKQFLATQIGVSRFRQRCLSDDGSKQTEDDEVSVSELVKIQLVVLDFCPRTTEEDQMMITASRDNDLFTIEKLLQCPCKPEMTDIRGRTP